jgi:5-(aminomethyl)-3-furanmethanol phosphate kinase
MSVSLSVVKVGGSLYEWPDLAERLARWLAPFPAVLLVPGGGPSVDAVRALDRAQRLGEEASHWLALRALSLNAHFLAGLLPEAAIVTAIPEAGRRLCILEPYTFFRRDEERGKPLPHRWEISSDSLAVRVAERAGASVLILLKSIGWDTARPWEEASRAQVVDAYFREALRQSARPPTVRIVNLRQWTA